MTFSVNFPVSKNCISKATLCVLTTLIGVEKLSLNIEKTQFPDKKTFMMQAVFVLVCKNGELTLPDG